VTDILALRNRATLVDFATSNLLVAFDYDGTLAPLAPTPALARMRASTRRLLVEVARRYPCVVISGRSLGDVTRRLAGIPVWYIFGNFGHEPVPHDHLPPARVGDWARALAARLPADRGLVVERKRYSVTIHYRQAPDKRWALRTIKQAIRAIADARIVAGRQTVTLLPLEGPDKGVALRHAQRLFHCDCALYVGDDDADEDAFASLPGDRLLSIRVGARRKSAAGYRLMRQSDIDRLLRVLLALRARAGRHGLPGAHARAGYFDLK
jgi:trehalose 6-phosphate phosphatase